MCGVRDLLKRARESVSTHRYDSQTQLITRTAIKLQKIMPRDSHCVEDWDQIERFLPIFWINLPI